MLHSSTLWAVSVLLFSSLSTALPQLLKRATVSPDGTCGGSKGYTCQGSNYGNSCGKYNLCGRDTSYSELSQGCQPAYGFCYAKGSVSPDGSCGGSDMFICIGSNYGNSCGPNNKCGADAGYSGAGCQPQYGYCQTCTTTVAPSTTTTTISVTPSTVTSTSTVSTRTTVSSGVTTITPSTVTSTSTVSTTNTISSGTTTITPSTVTSTATATELDTVSSGTVTVTTTNSVVFQKRAAATYPVLALPLTTGAAAATAAHRLKARATGPGLSCGTVITSGGGTSTVRTTNTITATQSTTVTSTSTITTPASTSTVTATVKTTITSTFSTTVPAGTSTVTATTTVTTTSTTTTTVPAATTTVGTAGPIYSKAYERTDSNTCFYSGSFYAQVGVSGDPTNNYQAGVTQCSAACTAGGTQCQSFYFSESTDPSGNPGAYCLLSASPYVSGSVTCNYQTTTVYLVDYNKVQ